MGYSRFKKKKKKKGGCWNSRLLSTFRSLEFQLSSLFPKPSKTAYCRLSKKIRIQDFYYINNDTPDFIATYKMLLNKNLIWNYNRFPSLVLEFQSFSAIEKTPYIEGFHVTLYQANFASHHTRNRHVGFLLAWHGQEKKQQQNFPLLFIF